MTLYSDASACRNGDTYCDILIVYISVTCVLCMFIDFITITFQLHVGTGL